MAAMAAILDLNLGLWSCTALLLNEIYLPIRFQVDTKGFGVMARTRIQDGCHGGHLGFDIGVIFMLCTSHQ